MAVSTTWIRSPKRSSMRVRPATTSSKSLVSATRRGGGVSMRQCSYPQQTLAIPVGVRRPKVSPRHTARVEMDAVRLTVPFEAIDLANVDEFTRWARDRIATDAPDDGAV